MATVRFFFRSPLCDFAILSTISLPYRTVRESPVLQSALARLGHVVLTLAEHVQLMADIFEFTEHTGVPFNEPVDVIPHPGLDAKLFNDRLERPEVVTRNPGEQVVDRLELKTSVYEVHPGRTEDVHRGSKLSLGEGLVGPEVARRHTPVGQGDLDVEQHGDHVRDEDESDSGVPIGQGLEDEEVTENEPVAGHADEFGRTGPGGGTERFASSREQVAPTEDVQVEPGDGHDRVIRVLLVRNHQLARLVPHIGEIVVRRVRIPELGRAGGKDGDVLGVRVVFGRVGDEVMNVVRRFPPADGESATKVGDEDSDEGIWDKLARDSTVSGVMSGEHDLLPEEPEEHGRGEIVPRTEESDEEREEQGVPDHLLGIVAVSTGVEPLVLDTFMQRLELFGDNALGLDVGRRIFCETFVDPGLDELVDHLIPGLGSGRGRGRRSQNIRGRSRLASYTTTTKSSSLGVIGPLDLALRRRSLCLALIGGRPVSRVLNRVVLAISTRSRARRTARSITAVVCSKLSKDTSPSGRQEVFPVSVDSADTVGRHPFQGGFRVVTARSRGA